jgi:hypothetical protein
MFRLKKKKSKNALGDVTREALARDMQAYNRLVDLSTQKMYENLNANDPDMRRAVLLQGLMENLTDVISDSNSSARTLQNNQPTMSEKENRKNSNTQPRTTRPHSESSASNRGRLRTAGSSESVNDEFFMAREYFRDSDGVFNFPVPKPPVQPPPLERQPTAVSIKKAATVKVAEPPKEEKKEPEKTLPKKEATQSAQQSSQDITASAEDVHPVRIPPRTTSYNYNKNMINADEAEKLIATINDDPKLRAEKRRTAGILFTESELDDLFKKVALNAE